MNTQGFEKYTYKPTDEEKEIIIPELAKVMKYTTKKSPYTNDQIRHLLRDNAKWYNIDNNFIKNIRPYRVRRLLNYMVFTDVFEGKVLCSSSQGYYLSDDPKHIKDVLDSLKERISAQRARVDKMQNQLNQINNQ